MSLKNRMQTILQACQGKSVLHLGCGDWPYTQYRIERGELLHSHISNVCRRLIGVDISPEGIKRLRELDPTWDLRLADACTFQPEQPVEVVVASELIEHLENPGDLLRGIGRWAGPATSLVITTPNAYALKGALRALVGREFCHPDHTTMFSTACLTQLLERTGWQAERTEYYCSSPTNPLSRIPAAAISLLGRLASPRLGDGLIVSARRQSRAETNSAGKPATGRTAA